MGVRAGSAFALPALALAACSPADQTAANRASSQPVAASAPADAPDRPAAPATPAVAGFDPARAPVVNPSLGAFPYFGLLAGYVPLAKDKATAFDGENLKDAAFDRYEFFDGVKLIPVEGRLRTVKAIGQGRSFFEVQKNYEKLVHDLGGVTVWEGGGQVMADRNIDFAERRHRNRYTTIQWEKMGTYMVRTPTRELWIEVYQTNGIEPDNYWLTIVEKKGLEVSAKLVAAETMRKALDADGRIALYLNFDTDKTVVRPESQPTVAEIVKLLEADPTLKLVIEGHTDDAGTPAHNQKLSQGRANAVLGLLLAQGIDGARLQARGFGQARPIGDNGNADGRARNRRVELVKR